ncbi:hypothetical protein S40288_11218 [Stachybotrys chartarum IBT 40288]|nr:hypothetical protein S40288_11218 [Stachybotrys chartarum IBT 40288]
MPSLTDAAKTLRFRHHLETVPSLDANIIQTVMKVCRKTQNEAWRAPLAVGLYRCYGSGHGRGQKAAGTGEPNRKRQH